jgi:hypothetical protein
MPKKTTAPIKKRSAFCSRDWMVLDRLVRSVWLGWNTIADCAERTLVANKAQRLLKQSFKVIRCRFEFVAIN